MQNDSSTNISQSTANNVGNVIPTQTFLENDGSVSNHAVSGVINPEEMLSNIPSSDTSFETPEEDLRTRLLNHSIGRIFVIASILLVVIIGIAAILVVQSTRNDQNKPQDSTGVLASLKNNSNNNLGQENLKDDVLSVNSNTIITQAKYFTTTGDVLVQSTTDSAKAFRIQNANGDNLLVANAKTKKIGINQDPTGKAALQVNGDISTNGAIVSSKNSYSLSDEGLRLGNVLVCTSKGCISLNPPPPVQASPTIDVANIAYLSANQIFSGNNTLSGTNNFTGANTFASATTFNAPVQVAGNVNSNIGFSVNGTAGSSITCAPGELLQQAIVSGGIITSGLCVPGAGASIATLQQSYDASVPAKINLSSLSGALQLQDATSPLAGNLFEVSNNGGVTTYFAVNNLGISVTGNINTTGQYQVSGVQISSANLSDAANLAKLNANQTFSGNNTFSSAGNSFTGNGAGLTNVNAAQLNGQAGSYYTNATNISTGTLNDARLSNNVALLNALQTFTNVNTFSNAGNSFMGNGSGLTSLNASNVASGTLNDSRLSANVGLLNANQTFSGNNTFSSASNSFTGSGAGLTSLNGSNISSGTVADARLSANVALLNALQTFAGANTFSNASNSFTGSGAGLTSLNASNLSSGTVNDARLSTNVTLAGNTFNGASQLVQNTAGGILPILSGANLTSLNATNVSSGTLNDARLSANVALLNANQTFSGNNTFSSASNSFTGNGAGLTSLNGSNISSGTVSDARLSANVALKNGNNTFTADNSFHLSSAALTVQDASSPLAGNLFEVTDNSGATKYFSVSATGAKIGANDICTTAGNCAGVGGGVTTAGGTTNKLAKFTAGSAIGDSIITDNGSTVTIGGTLAVNTITPTASLTIGTASQTLALQGDSSTSLSATSGGITNSLVFASPSGGNKTLTIPNATGTLAVSASGPLALDAAGNLTCATCLTSGGGGSGGVSSINSLNGALSLQGTSNQISVNSAGVTITLSTPQDIATSSSPTFANTNVTGQFKVNGSQISSADLSNDANLAKVNGNTTFSGNNTFSSASNSFTGSGAGLTSLNASNLSSGTVNDARLSANVALLNAGQTFTGANSFTGTLLFQNASNSTTAFQVQNAAGNSNLIIADTTNDRVGIGKAPTLGKLDVNGAIYQSGNQVCDTSGNCVGVSGGSIGGSGTAGTIAVFNGSGYTITDSLLAQSGGVVTATGDINVTGVYKVGGSQIASSNLSNDANLAKLNANQTFSGNNTFSSASNSFTGNGAGLTSLNGTNISSGTVNDARLSANVALLNATQTFTGNANLFQNASNSTTAFRIQNTAGTSNLFIADTTNTRIGIGKTPTLGTLDVNGAIYQSGNQVCDTSGNCVGVSGGSIGGGGTTNNIALFTGSGFTIGDSNLAQSGSVITATGDLNVTGQYKVGGSQIASSNLSDSANLAKLNGTGPQTFTGDNKFTGTVLSQNTADSTAAFQVQNAAGTSNLFVADTTNNRIGIGTNTPGKELDVVTNTNGTTRGISFTNTSNGTSATAGIQVANDVGSTGELGIQSSTSTAILTPAGQYVYLRASSASAGLDFVNGSSNNPFLFMAGASIERARIAGVTGYLGLADNNPSTLLSLSGTGTANGITLGDGAAGSVNLYRSGASTIKTDSNFVSAGTGLFQNAANSATAFQIQNTAGTSNLLIADTTNTRIGIAKAPTLGTLDVNGTIFQSGNQVCDTSGNCVGGGGSGAIGGGGTLNKIALFTGSGYTIGDSNLAQSGSVITATGDLNVTGQYKVGGSQIASSNLSDSANLAKLNGTGPQTFTGDNKFTGTVLAQNTADSTTAFQVQNAIGSQLFNVDTTNNNLVTNPSFETNTTGWVAKGASTISRTTSQAYIGNAALSVATTAAANDGAKYPVSLSSSTTYSIVTWVRHNSGTFNALELGRSEDGSTDTSCVTGQTSSTLGWVRIGCTFTTGTVSGSPYIYIKQTDATARTIYVDALQLTASGSITPYKEGALSLNGIVTSALTLQNAADSDMAFQIQNAAGTSNLLIADTRNSRIAIGTNSTTSLLNIGTNTTTSAGGITFGTDTNLYRSAADTLQTDDAFQAAGDVYARVGDVNQQTLLGRAGPSNEAGIKLGTAGDTVLYRVSAQNLRTEGNFELPGQLHVNCATAVKFCVTTSGQNTVLNVTGSSNILNLQNNNTDIATVSSTGATLFKNLTNSTSAFQIQNATGANVVNVNTSSDRVYFGSGLYSYLTNVVNDLATGGDFIVQNGDANQIKLGYVGSNSGIKFGSAADTNIYRSAADTLKTDDSLIVATNLTGNGTALFKNSADSTTAFQIQNAAGTGNNFVVDTTNGKVGIGLAPNGSGATLQVSGTVDFTGNLSFSGGDNQTVQDYADNLTFTSDVDNNGAGNLYSFLGNGNSNPILLFNNNGAAAFRNNTNSTTAFQIQNAAGTSNLLIADTTNTRVGIGKAPTLGTLDVNGSIYQSGNQVCDTSGNCVGSGGGGAIGGGGTAGKIALFTGTGYTIGDSNLSQSGGTITNSGALTNTGNTTFNGTVLAQNTADSTTAFQIQNAAGKNILDVDSTNGIVVLGHAGASGVTSQITYNYSGQSGNISLAPANPGASNYTITIPAETGTICTTAASVACTSVYAAGSGSGSYIQNGTSPQTADYNITGNGTIGGNATVAGSLKLTGGTSFPGSPTEGQVFFRTDTKQLYVYANGKWQADRSSSTLIVAASNSQNKEKADYVGDGTNDQNAINSAISALPAAGGSITLLEGTYNIAGTITMNKDNVTLTGAGSNTILKRMFNETVANTSGIITITASNLTIQQVYLDGNKATYSNANNHGIISSSMRTNIQIANSTVANAAGSGIYTAWNILGGAGFSSGWIISGVITSGNTGVGITLDRPGAIIQNSQSLSNNAGGIYIGYNGSASITNSTISSNGNYGLHTESAPVTVQGSTIDSNTGTGIENLNAGGTVIVTGNKVVSNTATGIRILGTNSNINSNNVSSNGDIGIYLQACTGCMAINNYVGSNANEGILVNNTTSNTISGNRLYDNGGSGTASAISLRTLTLSDIRVVDNYITDTAGTGYAILVATGAINTYISGNTYSGTGASSISDSGTGTIYDNQLDSSGNITMRSQAGIALNGTSSNYSLQNTGAFVQGGMSTPGAPTVTTQGTAGSTTWGYKVTAYDGLGETLASSETTIATGNATLTGGNFNRIIPARVNGAISYKIYRTTAGGTPNTTGLIGTLAGAAASFQFDDTGLAAGSAVPTTNATGQLQALGSSALFKNSTDSTTAFQIQNSGGADVLFIADTTARGAGGGNLIKIGNSTGTDTNTTILVVDNATADPTSNLGALNGGLFYNSTTNKLSIIENGAVKQLCNKTDLGCGSAATPTLAQVYGYGSSQTDSTILLDSTRGGVIVRDNASALGGTLFGVQSSTGGTKYLDVGAVTVTVSDDLSVTGDVSIGSGKQYKVNGVQISSANLSNDANLAKLNGTGPQTFTGNNKFTGTVLSQNTADSTTTFQIQNAAGTSNLLIADTTNSKIGIGLAPSSSGATLQVAGTETIASAGGGNVLGISGTNAGGSVGISLTNLGVSNASTTVDITALQENRYGGKISFGRENALGWTADITRADGYIAFSPVLDGVLNETARISSNGATKFKNVVDSTTAFQIQNAAGNNVLSADTSNGLVALGKASTLSGDLLFYNASGSGSIALQSANPASNNYTITLPAATGTVCLTSGNCAGVGGTGDILNNGNSFSAPVTIGTNDSNTLNFETNNNTVATFGTNGSALFKNSADSTTAFQVQNAAGTSNLFIADTTNSKIGIGITPNTSGALLQAGATTPGSDTNYIEVRNTSNNKTAGLYIDTAGNVGLRSNDVLNLQSTASFGYVNITPSGTANNSFLIQSPSSTETLIRTAGSATTLSLGEASVGSSVKVNDNVAFKANGSAVFKDATNSVTALQVQNNSASPLFTADTTNMRLGVDVSFTSMGTVTQNNTSTSTTGGTLAAATYFYKITAIDSAGGETTASNEKSQVTTGSTSTVTLSWVPVTGASGYKIYRSTSTNTEVYLTTTPGTNSGANLTFVDTGSITIGSASPPGTNTAYTSTNNSNNELQLSVGGLGTPTGQFYVSGTLPKLVGTAPSLNGLQTGCYGGNVIGNYLYLNYATGGGCTGGKLSIYDISNPMAPVGISSLILNARYTGNLVASGQYLYVPSSGTLNVVNISNPSSPSIVSAPSLALLGAGAKNEVIQGNYLYVLNPGGLTVLDISNPANPISVGSLVFSGTANDLAIQGKYLYMSGQHGTSNFVVVDVSKPSNPVIINSQDTGIDSGNISVQGRYAYVKQGSTLLVYDISNPTSPVNITTIGDNNGATLNSPILLQGRYAYSAAVATGGYFEMYDVSSPNMPRLMNGTSNVSNGPVVGNNGRYVYLGNNTNGNLEAYDLGGSYSQQFQAGGAQVGTLQVDSKAIFASDTSIQGGLNVGQNLQVAGSLGLGGGLNVQGTSVLTGGSNLLATPATPTVTPQGTTGATSYSYTVTAVNAYGGETLASTAGSTATGNATLGATNFNRVTWSAVSGASSYKIYRTASAGTPSSTGLVGSSASTTFDDTAIAANGVVSPTTNTSGQLTVQGSALIKSTTNSTTALQVQNSAGTNLLNADTSNMRLGVDVTYASMSVPSSLSVGAPTVGGSLAATTTYFYKVTAIDSAGGETTVSNESSNTTTSPNKTLPLTWTAVAGASGYKIYRSTTTNTEVYLTTVTTNSFTDSGSITIGSASPPGSNTAIVSTNNSNSSLQVSIGGNGTPTGQLYVSGVVPSAPVASVTSSSEIHDVNVRGRYAYVINRAGAGTLKIFDVSKPSNPSLIGTSAAMNWPNHVTLAGNYAYVNSGIANSSFYVVDISNPASPTIVNTITLNIDKPVIQGRYMYASINGGLSVGAFDISNPINPILVGSSSAITALGITSLTASGNYVYVAEDNVSNINDFQVFDVSNPSNPTPVGVTNITIAPYSLVMQGSLVYASRAGSGNTQIIDVSNPTNPTLISAISTSPTVVPSTSIQGRYLYAGGTAGINIVDVSNPYSPFSVGIVTTSTTVKSLYIQGRYAYTGLADGTLQIFDIGGTYTQQLEAGGAEFGNLSVSASARFASDASILGGLQIGKSLQVAGNAGLVGGLNVQGTTNLSGGTNLLASPATPTVTPQGTTGATSYSYTVTAVNAYGGETLASTAGSTASGNATLGATNFNRVTWSAVSGATSYKIYRTASAGTPNTTGYIGSSASTTFDDVGIAGAGNTSPTINTTGQLTV